MFAHCDPCLYGARAGRFWFADFHIVIVHDHILLSATVENVSI